MAPSSRPLKRACVPVLVIGVRLLGPLFHFTLIIAGVPAVETQLEILVHPGKKRFVFLRRDEWSNAWHVHVPAVPQKNAANRALIQECAKLFGVPVQIARGHTSTRKVLRIPLARAQVEQVIRANLDSVK